jgi:SH3-like domain-containing protein
MMLIATLDHWCKIKFFDNTEGWVHKNMISHKNNAIVVSDSAILYKYSSRSHPIAKIEKTVVVQVIKQESDWIKVNVNGMKGWLDKKCLWGINDDI